MQRRQKFLVIGSAIVIGGVTCCWWSLRPSGSAIRPGELSMQAARALQAPVPSVLQVPESNASPEAAPGAPEVATDEAREVAPPVPEDFDAKYRDATLKELEERSDALFTAGTRAGFDELTRLKAEGKYLRLTQEQVAVRERERGPETAGARQVHAKVWLGKETTDVGLIEFGFLDKPATAEIERERLFVQAKLEQVRAAEEAAKQPRGQ